MGKRGGGAIPRLDSVKLSLNQEKLEIERGRKKLRDDGKEEYVCIGAGMGFWLPTHFLAPPPKTLDYRPRQTNRKRVLGTLWAANSFTHSHTVFFLSFLLHQYKMSRIVWVMINGLYYVRSIITLLLEGVTGLLSVRRAVETTGGNCVCVTI